MKRWFGLFLRIVMCFGLVKGDDFFYYIFLLDYCYNSCIFLCERLDCFLCRFIKWGAYSCSISWSSGAAVQFPEKLLGLREKRNCRETNLIFCQLQNRVSNWQAIFWAILWANGGRSEKSATWVFFRMDPFS